MTKWLVGLMAGTLCAAIAGPAEAKWLRADTDNFIIFSEGSEKSLRDFADKLERFDATLRMRFGFSHERAPNRLTVYLVERATDAGKLTAGRLGPNVAGFYVAHREGSFAVSHRETNGIKGTPEWQQTLFHEYSHHFMMRYLTAAFPAWFVEGFAEYYSTTDFTKEGKAEIGKAPYGRAYGLLEMPKIPAEKLLLQEPSAMRSAGQADVYYGRAWLLTHMLLNDPAREGQLGSYIRAINKGVDAKKAATEAFGDLSELDRALNRYLDRRLAYHTTGASIPVAGPIAVTVLSAGDAAIVPLQLERKSANGDEALLVKIRDALAALAALHADDAGIWYELAMTEWSRGEKKRDLGTARAAVDKALALEPKHVRANVLLGRIMMADLRAKDNPSAAEWSAARKPIILANRTDPDDPMPLLAYYESFLGQRSALPDIAVDGLARSFELAPENVGVRISYIFALVDRGEFDTAIQLAKSVAFDPHGNGDELALLERIEAAKARRDGKKADTGDVPATVPAPAQ